MIYVRWALGSLLLAATWCVAYVMLEFPDESLYPTTVLGGAAVGGSLILAGMWLRRHNSVLRIFGYVALCGGYLGCLAPLNDRPISRFRTAYHSIRLGMTANDVDAVLSRNFPIRKPTMGWDQERQHFVAALVTLDPTLSEDFSINLEAGRVVDKRYGTD